MMGTGTVAFGKGLDDFDFKLFFSCFLLTIIPTFHYFYSHKYFRRFGGLVVSVPASRLVVPGSILGPGLPQQCGLWGGNLL